MYGIVDIMRVRNPVEFGNLLRDRRLTLNLSQAEVARRAHMQRTQLALLERGKGNPTLRTLLRLSEVLDLTLSFGNRADSLDPSSGPVLNLDSHLNSYERT